MTAAAIATSGANTVIAQPIQLEYPAALMVVYAHIKYSLSPYPTTNIAATAASQVEVTLVARINRY